VRPDPYRNVPDQPPQAKVAGFNPCPRDVTRGTVELLPPGMEMPQKEHVISTYSGLNG